MEERYSKWCEMAFFHHIVGLATDAISTRHGGQGPGGVREERAAIGSSKRAGSGRNRGKLRNNA